MPLFTSGGLGLGLVNSGLGLKNLVLLSYITGSACMACWRTTKRTHRSIDRCFATRQSYSSTSLDYFTDTFHSTQRAVVTIIIKVDVDESVGPSSNYFGKSVNTLSISDLQAVDRGTTRSRKRFNENNKLTTDVTGKQGVVISVQNSYFKTVNLKLFLAVDIRI